MDDALIAALASGERVLPYVDVPLQHGSDRMLRAMRRGTDRARQKDLVRRLRDEIPGLTLRTTVIVGFPGESDEDFEELMSFVAESRFDRLGVFRYSDEENTAALELSDKVPRAVARERYRALTELQRGIMDETLQGMVGRKERVLVDALMSPSRALGRLASQAPEIDGVVHLAGKDLEVGRFVDCKIDGVREVDLEATALP